MKFLLFFYSVFFLIPAYSAQSTAEVTGKIITVDGSAVPGATVRIPNSRFQATTNSEGTFLLTSVPPGSYVLNISRMGFAETNRRVDVRSPGEEITIVLEREPEKLGEVLVTAQKREEILQDIPISITGLSDLEVEKRHIREINDLTAIAPNLYSSDPGDKRAVTSVRGIVSTSYDPAVAVYLDGVNQFNLDTYINQLFDIERIEVLRGPQGTLYGRNAMGGVINIVTKQPKQITSAFAKATIGNYGRSRFAAGVRTPIIEDKLLFGAAGVYEESDGFYINLYNNSRYDQQRNLSGNYYLKYIVNPGWDLTLNLKHSSNRNQGPFPLASGIEEALENPFRLNQNELSEMVDNTLNTSLVIGHRGENLNFSSQTSYQQNYRYYRDALDADFSPMDIVSIYNNYGDDWNNVKVATQEFQISSPGGGENNFSWIAGSFLFYQESPVKQATMFGEDAGLFGSEDTNFSLINTTESSGKGIAFFGQATYAVTGHLDVIAGLRYDYENREQSVLGEYRRNSDAMPSFEFQQDTTANAAFSAFSPKAGLSFELTENHLAFASYSRGFRAGGLTPLSSDPAQPPLYPYKPEFSNNFEIGSKNTFFNEKLLLNVSLFYTEVTDVQVPTLVLPDAVTIIRNTGKLISKGGELELRGIIADGLEISYDLGITDAEYDSLFYAAEGGEENYDGKQQIFTPDFTSMLALGYSIDIGQKNKTRLFARGEWKYIGEQYFDLANTLRQGAYSLLNSSVGFAYKHWELEVWGRNIFDKHYISYAYEFGAATLGNPATYGATLSFKI